MDWQACPRGTYSNALGLQAENECTPCDAGKYCDGEHLTAATGRFIVLLTFYSTQALWTPFKCKIF